MSKRDSAYFVGRLKRDHPAVYTDFRAGRYASVRAASVAAGLVTPQTPLEVLKREWQKANRAEQAAFLKWVEASMPTTSRVSRPSPAPIVGADGSLLPAVKVRITKIMSDRRMKMGEVMLEMGFSARDASLGHALNRDTRVCADMQKALEAWIRGTAS